MREILNDRVPPRVRPEQRSCTLRGLRAPHLNSLMRAQVRSPMAFGFPSRLNSDMRGFAACRGARTTDHLPPLFDPPDGGCRHPDQNLGLDQTAACSGVRHAWIQGLGVNIAARRRPNTRGEKSEDARHCGDRGSEPPALAGPGRRLCSAGWSPVGRGGEEGAPPRVAVSEGRRGPASHRGPSVSCRDGQGTYRAFLRGAASTQGECSSAGEHYAAAERYPIAERAPTPDHASTSERTPAAEHSFTTKHCPPGKPCCSAGSAGRVDSARSDVSRKATSRDQRHRRVHQARAQESGR